MFLLWEKKHTFPLTADLELPALHPWKTAASLGHTCLLMAKQKEERKKFSVSGVAVANGVVSHIF